MGRKCRECRTEIGSFETYCKPCEAAIKRDKETVRRREREAAKEQRARELERAEENASHERRARLAKIVAEANAEFERARLREEHRRAMLTDVERQEEDIAELDAEIKARLASNEEKVKVKLAEPLPKFNETKADIGRDLERRQGYFLLFLFLFMPVVTVAVGCKFSDATWYTVFFKYMSAVWWSTFVAYIIYRKINISPILRVKKAEFVKAMEQKRSDEAEALRRDLVGGMRGLYVRRKKMLKQLKIYQAEEQELLDDDEVDVENPVDVDPGDSETPHEILGVDEDATDEEIRAAYHDLSKMYHPDRMAGMSERMQKKGVEMMVKINNAYSQLKRTG